MSVFLFSVAIYQGIRTNLKVLSNLINAYGKSFLSQIDSFFYIELITEFQIRNLTFFLWILSKKAARLNW